MDIATLTGLAAGLLFLVSVCGPIADRLRIPFALLLTGAGAALIFGLTAFQDFQTIKDLSEQVTKIDLPSGLFLQGFLPLLIFQVSLSIEVRRMAEDTLPILILAVLAVIAATGVIGLALYPFTGLPLLACLLIGATVSTTDPSAVVGIFRSINAPARLVRLIEGESLLNDAAAIALFSTLIAAYGVISETPDPLMVMIELPYVLAGGLAIGVMTAGLLLKIAYRMKRHPLSQITMTLALPFAASLSADAVGASGVVAAFGAGVTLNLSGAQRLRPETWERIQEFWAVLAHWGGAILFLLGALLIPRLLEGAGLKEFLLTLLVAAAALFARALVLWGVLPILSATRMSPKISHAYKAAVLWGGLRGAITLALALAATEALFLPKEIKNQIGSLATGYVLFTLIIQGATLRPLIRWLHLDRLSSVDQALSKEVIAVALETVREEVSDEARGQGVSPEILRREAKILGSMAQEAIKSAETADEVLDSQRIVLGLMALAGRERDLIMEARREGRTSPALHQRLTASADRILEQTRSDGRTGYRRAYQASMGLTWRLTAASRLHSQMAVSRPLERLTEARFEMLIAQLGLIDQLMPYIDTRIRRIHGKRVTEILRELLNRRQEDIQGALDGLRLQFPGYAEEAEARWVRRRALEVEEREYRKLLADRLIDAELFSALIASIGQRRAQLDNRPRLDMGAQKTQLLQSLPGFSELDARKIRKMAKSLKVLHVAPGDLLRSREDKTGRILLIGSGAVAITTKAGGYNLGPGEMLGHLSILTQKPRRFEARALTHGTLFVLDEDRLRRLLAGSEVLRDQISQGAERAGVSLAKEAVGF